MNQMFKPIVNSMYGELIEKDVPRSMFVAILNSRYGITTKTKLPIPEIAGIEFLCPKYPERDVAVYRAFNSENVDYIMNCKWTPWHILVSTESFLRIGGYLQKLNAPEDVMNRFNEFSKDMSAQAETLYAALKHSPVISELFTACRLQAKGEIFSALYALLNTIRVYMQDLGRFLIRLAYCEECVKRAGWNGDPEAAKEYLDMVMGYIRRMGGYCDLVDAKTDLPLRLHNLDPNQDPIIQMDLVRYYDPLEIGEGDSAISFKEAKES